MRKAIRNTGHLRDDEAEIRDAEEYHGEARNVPRQWYAAKAQFAIQFGARFVLTA